MRKPNFSLRLDPATLWLLAWTLIVLAATLLPGNFEWRANHRGIVQITADEFRDALDIVLNILLFLPIGVLLVLRLSPRGWSAGRLALMAGATAFAFSFTIETLQYFLPSRESSLVDVLSNTLGALAGTCASTGAGHKALSHLRRFRLNASPLGRAGVLAGYSLVIIAVSGVLQYSSRLSNWDEHFLLMVGNENTGDRPWRGRVLRIDLSDVSTPEELLSDFAAGNLNGLGAGSIAAIRFASNTHFEDAVHKLPPLVWVAADGSSTSTGLKVTGKTWLRSAEPPKELARRIWKSNEFTLRVTCASDDVDQEGPARVLSYSVDPLHGNFTVGQEGPDLVFRVRTPITGPIGARIPIVIPGVFSTTEVRDILFSYSGSTLRVAVAGSNKVHSLEFSPGATLANFYLSPQPQDFKYFEMIYYGFVLLPQIALFAWLTPSTAAYFAAGISWLVTLAAVLEVTLAFASARAFDAANWAMIVLTGLTILVVVQGMLKTAHRSTSIRGEQA